jgi:hypothetical protein
MARIQHALASVTERFQGFDQFRGVCPALIPSLTAGGAIQLIKTYYRLFLTSSSLFARFPQHQENLKTKRCGGLDGGISLCSWHH